MSKCEVKNIMLVALGGILYYLLSFLGHKITVINFAVFLIICAGVLILSIKKFELAAGIAFLELVLGSHGRLFTIGGLPWEAVSIRMAIFIIIISVWIIKKLTAYSLQLTAKRIWFYIPLLIAVIWGVFRGFINGNSFNNIFADANAFLFFGYLGPSIEAIKTAGWGRVKNFLAGGIIALWVITMFSAIEFSNGLFEIGDGFYRWIRDSRLGEVTFVNNRFFRVFLQSHIFALFGFFLIVSSVKRHNLWDFALAILSASIVWIDLSRSFWTGAAAGIFVLIFILIRNRKLVSNLPKWFLTIFLGLSAGFILGTILIPSLPQVVFGRGTSISEPMSIAEPAAMSRKAMLSPLFKEIIKNPVLGSGFGTSITYKTSDPRALARNPSGEMTTFAFEWGWLDLWVKTGLLGVLAYIGLILAVLGRLYRQFRLTGNGLYLGALAGIIALAVTHTFSPYLNHPLGIGLLLLADSIAENS